MSRSKRSSKRSVRSKRSAHSKRSKRSAHSKRSKRSAHSVGGSKRTKKPTKSYSRVDANGKEHGNYTGSSPEKAGKNAGKKMIRDSKFKQMKVNVTIKQKSHGPTRGKEFKYVVSAIKLKTPIKKKFGKETITVYYEYEVHADK